jgi:hypothetical protein
MDTSDQIKPRQKYNRLAIVSFVLGLLTLIFPIISIGYLIAENGGPRYMQSVFCGIPVTYLSIMTGIVSLVQIRRKNQKGGWMAILGIVLGILVFGILSIFVVILISPYLFTSLQ